MNRLLSLAVAGVVSAALASAGCENKDKHHEHDGHDHMHASSSSSSSASSNAAASARATGDGVAATPADVRVSTNGDSASAAARAGHDANHAAGAGTVADARPADATIAAARTDATAGAAALADAVKSARAEVEASKAPGMDDVKGVVEFMAAPDGKGVAVHYDIKGLTPGQHGFHIHEKGDLSAPDLTSAGPHFNPAGHKHGGPDKDARHGGDLGNITADDNGVAKGQVLAAGVTLDESPTGILGRSIVVHEKADDLATDPSGNSGARVGAGVIKAGGAKAGGRIDGDRVAPQGEKDAGNPAKQDKK